MIEAEDVEKIAQLAKLKFDDEGKIKVAMQLNRIIAYVEKLDEVDTTDVPPTYHVLNLKNVLRDDKVEESLSQDEVLANAPSRKDGYFSVPKVIG